MSTSETPIVADSGKYPWRPMAFSPFNIVLYEPEIPFNTGNVGRTCVAVGAKLWLVRPLGFQIEDRYLRRAGMDYWQHLDYEIVNDWQDLEGRLPDRPRWFLTKTAQRPYTEARFQAGDILIFGGESRGLPAWMLEAANERCLRIPMQACARSLNLSVSAAVVVYEARRQVGWE